MLRGLLGRLIDLGGGLLGRGLCLLCDGAGGGLRLLERALRRLGDGGLRLLRGLRGLRLRRAGRLTELAQRVHAHAAPPPVSSLHAAGSYASLTTFRFMAVMDWRR